MKKKIIFKYLLPAIICVSGPLQVKALTLRTDTIMFIDTITTKETITKSEVIERTKKVVRYYDNGVMVEKNLDTPTFSSSETSPKGGYMEVGGSSVNADDTKMIYVDTLYRPGGRFVWVPDSMNVRVNRVLAGADRPNISLKNNTADGTQAQTLFDSENPVDLQEKVVFRGDTINMVLKDRNLGRFDRGLFNFLFIPKGIWQLGLTASYGEFSTKDLEILDLISDVDFYGKLWSIRPYFAYFIKSNLSVGLRLGYTHGKAKIGTFNVDIDEDMSFNLHDIMYKSNGYSASITLSQYLGIARKGRFGVFNEVELLFAGNNSDFHRPYNGELRKTHTTTFETALNFSPGVCVYMVDQLSFNVSLGVFGLNIKHSKQKVDGEDLGSRTTSGANFRFNIFNINFGIAVNI